jgi:hypothetical protein
MKMAKSMKAHWLAKKILIWWNKLSFPALDGIFSLAEKTREAENVLICLPTKKESFNVAKDHLTIFTDIFRNKKIFVFLPLVRVESFLPHLQGYEVIYPQKGDLGTFSLPRKKFIRRMRDYHFEMALDLDWEDGFVNSYLCLKSGAKVRIGLKGKTGFPFYNLQLVLSEKKLCRHDLYVRVAAMLKSLFPEFAVDGKENRNSI